MALNYLRFLQPLKLLQRVTLSKRFMSCGDDEVVCPSRSAMGLLVGLYSKNDGKHEDSWLTPTGDKYDKRVCGRLWDLLRIAGPAPKIGELRIFYGLDREFTAVGVVGLGIECAGYNEEECIDQGKENIRIASGAGARGMAFLNLNRLYVEGFGHAESSAEGAALGIWLYQEYKNIKNRKHVTTLELYDDCDWTGWQIGLQKAAAQNLARQLMECPANIMTPITFAQTSVDVLCRAGVNVEVKVRDWAQIQGMGGFLAVAKGSCQEPIFMEISYYGTGDLKERPILLVGKGCTFDSGGIGLGKPHILKYMRGDLSGAACIVAAVRAIANLQLPLNIRGLIPLCEHMPGCNAMKPGDVAVTCNGKSIFIHDVRCEGRLMMADALAYGQNFWPKFIVDVGTLTKGVRSALSTAACGVFSNSDRLWDTIRMASIHTGDRMWRLPLFKHYTKKVTHCQAFDLLNYGRRGMGIGFGFGADPCKAAAFLREFVPCGEWMHIDNYGVMWCDGKTDPPYLKKGMAGRPTRTLIEFLSQLVCKHE